VTDTHHRTELSFVDEFPCLSLLHYLKRTDDRTLFFFGAFCKRGPPCLHYYCAVMLHSYIVVPPVGHCSNHEYHFCLLRRQSSCVSNFYPTLNFSFHSLSYFALWCIFQAGPSCLHYHCAVVLHSYIVLPPIGHCSNHEYHFCLLRRQSSCVSNFYPTLKFFISLSLVFRSLVHFASGGRHVYTTTAPSCCIPTSYCHLSATVQTMSIIFVSLEDDRAVFRIFIPP